MINKLIGSATAEAIEYIGESKKGYGDANV